MAVWVLTGPPLGGRGDGDEQEDGVDVAVYQFVHLRLFEGLLIVVMVTAHKHLWEGHKQ